MEGEPNETTPAGTPGGAPEAGGGEDAQPGEEEMRAKLEEEVRKLRVEEVILQSAASIVNLTARRIAKEDERDLEQGRVGIEAVRALLPLMPAEAQGQFQNAVSELQMLYARASGAGEGGEGPAPSERGAGQAAAQPAQESPRKEPGRPPPKLWTPPGT